ncbi:MAG TPA: SGNH/GDSL hydrolase family protein [Bryobacteraceae bacterium]|jgi:lysophospholipase L1-like esterase
MNIRFALTAAMATGLVFAQAPVGDHWVTTWAASPQARAAAPARPANAPAPVAQNGPPRAPQVSGFNNQTLRLIVHTTIGGRRLRVRLSNDFGAAPLKIGAAQVALRSKESATVPGSGHALLFSGKSSCTIPAGAETISDPVDLDLPPSADVAVSVYVPGETGPATYHGTGLHTSYISKEGDFAAAPEIAEATTTQSWFLLAGIDVLAPADAAAIVAFGDSITDGATSTPDTDRSWPSQLAQRLLANPSTAHIAVVNEGISGNRVLKDGAGVSALARFDRDVLAQSGVKWLVIMESINDIGQGLRANAPAADAVTADDLTAVIHQMIDRAHAHGIKVIGATLTPFEGAAYYSDRGEEVREAVNRWIRTSGEFDGVIDFDAVTRDANNPKTFRADYNLRDHLHPNDAGYKAMADSIDLSLFGAKPTAR